MLHADFEILPHGARTDALEATVKLIAEAKRLIPFEGLLHGGNYDGLVVLPCDVTASPKGDDGAGKPLSVSIMNASLP
jgi:hypothetical protein